MRLPNRLVMPAHDAERHHRAAVLDEHRRDDRVQWPLPRRNRIRVARDRAEARAAVLQQYPTLRRKDAGAEAGEQRVDKGAGVAVSIYDTEVDGVLVLDIRPGGTRECAVESNMA